MHPTYAYIDESGTLVEHQVMTVSLVLIGGRRAAERMGESILKKLYHNVHLDKKRIRNKTIHFADMTESDQIQVAQFLANESIKVFVSYHWHTNKSENHTTRFTRYVEMLKHLMRMALQSTANDLNIVIAQQGSPETYKAALFAELGNCAELDRLRSGVYRNIKFELRAAKTQKGLQLADFYAGAVRKMWIDYASGKDFHRCLPHVYISHQITMQQIFDLQ